MRTKTKTDDFTKIKDAASKLVDQIAEAESSQTTVIQNLNTQVEALAQLAGIITGLEEHAKKFGKF